MKHIIILLTATIFLGACMGHGYRKDRDYANSKQHNHKGKKEENAKHIDLLSATKNSFQPGVIGNAGTTYSFEIYTKVEGISFGKVWLSKNKTFAYNPVDVETSLRPKTTKNRKLSFKITDPKNNNAVGETLPIKFFGDAVIQYFINGKANYLIVNDIKELERVIHD